MSAADRLPAALLDPRGLAAGRTLVGVTMLTQPGLIPALLGVDKEARRQTSWVVQMLGAREIALGLGALAPGSDKRTWLAAGLLSDAVDTVAVGRAVLGRRANPLSGAALTGVALVASAIGAKALRGR